MTLLVVSFLAGALTVLAPCILPLLPVVIGAGSSSQRRLTPYIVVLSLGLSVIIFTFLLKVTTLLISVPPSFWQWLSGGLIFLIGLALLFPVLWEKLPLGRLSAKANIAVGQGVLRHSFYGDVLTGAALGPVFSTCSPTYFFILASVLPASLGLGFLYLLSFVAGLVTVLLALTLIGERLVAYLLPLSDSRGLLKRSVGLVLIVLSLFVITGYDKKVETYLIKNGWGATGLEYQLLEKTGDEEAIPDKSGLPLYREIESPAGFVNSEPFQLKDLVGKQVILIDFMTYSCINCQRTFPYLNAWYEAYKDQGLTVVGIHTPEFAFEQNIENVRKAAEEFGLKFPIVLDNDYATWRAYGNRYWPRKYLIDINGHIVYDHIGEGKYEETEKKIRELLEERSKVLAEQTELGEIQAAKMPEGQNFARSPETYFGSARNKFSPQVVGQTGVYDLSYPTDQKPNSLYHDGKWKIEPEFAESIEGGSSITYRYFAKEVYLVAESKDDAAVEMEVWQDGVKLGTLQCLNGVCEPDPRGDDVSVSGVVSIKDSRLYKLIKNQTAGEHTLELRFLTPGVRLFAFTFG